MQCVFVGYNTQYKGYRCLYPPSGKVCITRHAIFDEDCYPFKSHYKDLVPRYDTTLLQAWQSATHTVRVAPTDSQVTHILTPPLPAAPEANENA